jgi:ABC-2 type transport system ATP-binding protein
MTNDLAIEVTGLTKAYGRLKVLQNIDLNVTRGSVFGLLGPNGAGKTTLVKILSTLLKADSGTALVAGHDVRTDPSSVRASIGLAGQYATVDEMLTARENLELIGLLYHQKKKERKLRAQEILEQMSLADVADRPVKTYSGGMRRRLDIGASLIGRPKVLFLDEPTTGLDPRPRNDLWESIEQLVADGTTVLLTTQYMEEAEHLAHRIMVIDSGQVIAQGTAASLKQQIGGDVLVASVSDPADLDRARLIVTSFGDGAAVVDTERRRVTVPTNGGAQVLVAAGERLVADGIRLEDLGIRRPSLDEVFLALTGRSNKPAEEGAEPSVNAEPVLHHAVES